MTEETQGNTQAPEGPQFALQRIYVKDLSFETPNSPQIFLEQWKPDINLNLNTQVQELGDDLFEVTLTITVTVKSNDKTAFLVEVQQAGVFLIRAVPKEQMGPLVGINCPNILFPYARETISDLATRGSFPQLLLQPINFEALYQQRLQQMQAKQQAAGAEKH
jgi:preprotein translocase subunit SecB